MKKQKSFAARNISILDIQSEKKEFDKMITIQYILIVQSNIGTKSKSIFVCDNAQLEIFYDVQVAINTDTVKFLIGEENYNFLKSKKATLKYMEEMENYYPMITLERFIELNNKFVWNFTRGIGLYSTFSLISSIHGEQYWKRVFFNI